MQEVRLTLRLFCFLRPYEAAIAIIQVYFGSETGAIKATGHKIISIESEGGKLVPAQIKAELDLHKDEHMVKPRLVYISNSTEIGTVYTKFELEQLSQFCKDNNLLLFMDGARLGSALCTEDSDLELKDLPNLEMPFISGVLRMGHC